MIADIIYTIMLYAVTGLSVILGIAIVQARGERRRNSKQTKTK